jgi:hypothetical protein
MRIAAKVSQHCAIRTEAAGQQQLEPCRIRSGEPAVDRDRLLYGCEGPGTVPYGAEDSSQGGETAGQAREERVGLLLR